MNRTELPYSVHKIVLLKNYSFSARGYNIAVITLKNVD
jgi:hypothetical protein